MGNSAQYPYGNYGSMYGSQYSRYGLNRPQNQYLGGSYMPYSKYGLQNQFYGGINNLSTQLPLNYQFSNYNLPMNTFGI